MADEPGDQRRRFVAGAADMIARRGLRSTSIRDLAHHSDVPLGSTYHYFPGGKQQLAIEALNHHGDQVLEAVGSEWENGPVAVVEKFYSLARTLMAETNFQSGCPVLAVSVENASAPEHSLTLSAAANVFDRWVSALAESLLAHGVSKSNAQQVATLTIASLEGGLAMCRASRSLAPLDSIAPALQRAVTAALPRNGQRDAATEDGSADRDLRSS